MLDMIVCMKVTVDTSQIKADPTRGAPKLLGAPLRVSTFDENALEEAVRFKEAAGGVIRGLSLVAEPPPMELVLRALAMGADEFCLVRDESASRADSLATATILAAAIEKLPPWQIVWCGDGSLDDYNRQLGPRLGEALGVEVLTHVIRAELAGETVVAHRALEDRTEIVEADLPVIVTVGQEINRPRFPTVLQIMGSSRKPVTEWSLGDLGIPAEVTAATLAGTVTLDVFAPSVDRKRIEVNGEDHDERARKLSRLLLQEGAVRGR